MVNLALVSSSVTPVLICVLCLVASGSLCSIAYVLSCEAACYMFMYSCCNWWRQINLDYYFLLLFYAFMFVIHVCNIIC